MSYLGSRDFLLEVVKGNVAGHTFMHKYGRNPDIDNSADYEALWNGGGLYTGFNATAAETVEVFSDDASDAAAGTGARTVRIFGLDGDYNEQEEVITLNGVTAVDSANTYIRCFRLIVESAGSGGENAGEITVRQNVTTANVFVVIPAAANRSTIAAYTIPAGKTAALYNWAGSIISKLSGNISFRMCHRPVGEVFQLVEDVGLKSDGQSSFQRHYDLPLLVEEKTDIVLEGSSDTNNIAVSGSFDLVMWDN